MRLLQHQRSQLPFDTTANGQLCGIESEFLLPVTSFPHLIDDEAPPSEVPHFSYSANYNIIIT